MRKQLNKSSTSFFTNNDLLKTKPPQAKYNFPESRNLQQECGIVNELDEFEQLTVLIDQQTRLHCDQKSQSQSASSTVVASVAQAQMKQQQLQPQPVQQISQYQQLCQKQSQQQQHQQIQQQQQKQSSSQKANPQQYNRVQNSLLQFIQLQKKISESSSCLTMAHHQSNSSSHSRFKNNLCQIAAHGFPNNNQNKIAGETQAHYNIFSQQPTQQQILHQSQEITQQQQQLIQQQQQQQLNLKQQEQFPMQNQSENGIINELFGVPQMIQYNHQHQNNLNRAQNVPMIQHNYHNHSYISTNASSTNVDSHCNSQNLSNSNSQNTLFERLNISFSQNNNNNNNNNNYNNNNYNNNNNNSNMNYFFIDQQQLSSRLNTQSSQGDNYNNSNAQLQIMSDQKCNKGKRCNTVVNDSQFQIHEINVISDGRTSLCIKNIPNKYVKNQLIQAFNFNYKDKYDFIYLPFDFKSKCNRGYAFINFRNVTNVLDFYREFNGKKWQLYKSDKDEEFRPTIYDFQETDSKERIERDHIERIEKLIQNQKNKIREEAHLKSDKQEQIIGEANAKQINAQSAQILNLTTITQVAQDQ